MCVDHKQSFTLVLNAGCSKKKFLLILIYADSVLIYTAYNQKRRKFRVMRINRISKVGYLACLQIPS